MNLVILHEYNRKTIDVSNSCIINELMMSFLVTTSLVMSFLVMSSLAMTY